MISLIVPVYNEETHMERCVQSIVAQDYPKDDMEVIFVDGMSTDRTRPILSALIAEYPFLRMIDEPRRTISVAMNTGIRAAQGDIIIRLNARTIIPSNYVSELVKHLNSLHADNVGGVCQTLPANDTPLCKSIAAVLSSRFGMGNSYFRIGVDEIRQVDTVPLGCFRRSLFDKIGFYDEQLIRNQNDEFNGRIIKHDGRIYLLPHIAIGYYAQENTKQLWSLFYQYGLFKPLVNKKLGTPTNLRQFCPALFVLGLALGALLATWIRWIAVVFTLIVTLYIVIAFTISTERARREHCRPMLYQMPWLFFVVHCGYGVGYLHGIYKLLTNGNFNTGLKR